MINYGLVWWRLGAIWELGRGGSIFKGHVTLNYWGRLYESKLFETFKQLCYISVRNTISRWSFQLTVLNGALIFTWVTYCLLSAYHFKSCAMKKEWKRNSQYIPTKNMEKEQSSPDQRGVGGCVKKGAWKKYGIEIIVFSFS